MAEVETSRDGGVLTITLNRPDVLNAFTAELHKQLVGAFKEIFAKHVGREFPQDPRDQMEQAI